jgi:hypothetical protein
MNTSHRFFLSVTPLEVVRLFLLAVVLFRLLLTSEGTLTILWPPELAGFHCVSAQFYYKGISYDFAPLNNTKLVFPSCSESVVGNLVYSDVILPTQPVVRSYMHQGAIGVVFGASSDVPGRAMFETDGRDDSDITIPVAQVGPLSVIPVFDGFNGSYMIISLTSDGNQWRDVYESSGMVFAQVLVTATGLVVVALAIWKAVLFYRRHRFEYPIPLLCLLLDFFACLERSVYFAVDPRNIRKIFEKDIELALFYLSIPFTLSVAVLITFFWHDALVAHSLHVHSHLSKLRVPFLITIITLYTLQLVTIILAVLLFAAYTFIVYMVNACLLIVFAVSCSIYYIVIANRVVRRLKKSPLRSERPVKQITKLIVASAVGLFLFAALTLLGLMPTQDIPSSYAFWFCMLFITLNYIAATHVMSFHPLKVSQKTTTQLSADDNANTTKSENFASAEAQQHDTSLSITQQNN